MKRRGQSKKRSGPRRTKKSTLMKVPRGMFAAPRTRVRLSVQTTKSVNNAGSTVANIRFTPTYAYDVDPSLGSVAVPGFTEYGTLYRFYRVNSSSILVNFGNNEAFPITAYICPINYDPTANYNLATATSIRGQDVCRAVMLGPLTGVSTKRVSCGASTARFAGVRWTGQTDFYSGPTSGSSAPTNNWYFTVGVTSPQALVNGVTLDVVLHLEIEFFEVNTPTG